MDSTETEQVARPTVVHLQTFEDLGLTPKYIKVTLEDLAADQLETEKALVGVQRIAFVAVGFGAMGVALGLLAVKLQKMLLANMQDIGVALLATQQHVGMVPRAPEPVVVEPIDTTGMARVVVDKNQIVADEDTVVIGEGYDPGPQEIPDEVRRAVEELPVSDWLDEDGV